MAKRITQTKGSVSIPLKSGRCCKTLLPLSVARLSLNPFEVREVLQDYPLHDPLLAWCLNPFEVREVLQGWRWCHTCAFIVSIPLKSGRCCKIVTEAIIQYTGVSIPLKSGRCCKTRILPCCSLRWVSIPLKSGRCCKSALQNFLIKINKLFVSFR